jgi:putative phosphoribosyl transferase
MYFRDRTEAGELLAKQLSDYRFENTAVLALSPGGVVVGEAIARSLHCGLSMLLSSKISAPGEASLVLGTIDHIGNFSYNNLISPGQMEEYVQEFHNYIEEERMHHLFSMTTIVGQDGFSRPELLAGRNVIVVTDGVKSGISFEAAFAYLHKIPTEKVIAAVPVGPAEVLEQIKRKVDELHYLFVPDQFISVHHYYQDKAPQDAKAVLAHINGVIERWH